MFSDLNSGLNIEFHPANFLIEFCLVILKTFNVGSVLDRTIGSCFNQSFLLVNLLSTLFLCRKRRFHVDQAVDRSALFPLFVFENKAQILYPDRSVALGSRKTWSPWSYFLRCCIAAVQWYFMPLFHVIVLAMTSDVRYRREIDGTIFRNGDEVRILMSRLIRARSCSRPNLFRRWQDWSRFGRYFIFGRKSSLGGGEKWWFFVHGRNSEFSRNTVCHELSHTQ